MKVVAATNSRRVREIRGPSVRLTIPLQQLGERAIPLRRAGVQHNRKVMARLVESLGQQGSNGHG